MCDSTILPCYGDTLLGCLRSGDLHWIRLWSTLCWVLWGWDHQRSILQDRHDISLQCNRRGAHYPQRGAESHSEKLYKWISLTSSYPVQESSHPGQFVSSALKPWDSYHSGAETWKRCICFIYCRNQNRMSVASLPNPTPASSALALLLGRTRLWQSWDLMSDTPRMQLFYYWKGWNFTRERGWDEWVSMVFIETRCTISQGINRTMKYWQRGWFSVTVKTLQLFLELHSLFICIWILINRALAAYSWIFKWKYISHYYPLLVSQAPSCKFAAE